MARWQAVDVSEPMEAAPARHRFSIWIPLVALIFCGLPAGRAAAAPGGAVDLLLVLAVDASNSIDLEKAKLQRSGYVRAIAHPAVIAAIGMGRHGAIAILYLEWASPDEQYQVVDWTRIDGAVSALAFADTLERAPIEHGYWTSISAAIDRAASLIETAPFSSTRRMIDLSSDGRNNRGGPLLAARARALARGITINGLLVLPRRYNFSLPPEPGLGEYFDACVIGGPGAFTEIAEGIDDFVRAVRRKLVREIAGTSKGQRRAGLPGRDPILLVSAMPCD